jgi:hypothetical protein
LPKYLEAVEDATIFDASYAATNLRALGDRRHEEARAASETSQEEALGARADAAVA